MSAHAGRSAGRSNEAVGRNPGDNGTAVVIIGPAGCGKSSLARALAHDLGRRFIEGDAHHSPRSRAKMAGGQPLSHAERLSQLDSIGQAIAAASDGPVVSCSALRRAYRERLRSYRPDILFVWPDLHAEELERRVGQRNGHFMPPSLVADQLATFEPPLVGEEVLRVDGTLPISELLALVRGELVRRNS